jgi:hypothetical protein
VTRTLLRAAGLAPLLLLAEAVLGGFWLLCVLLVWGSVAAGSEAILRLLGAGQSPGPSGPGS